MAEAVLGLKIGVGTKIDDVYSDKEAFEQARLADKNGDHVIDKEELNRFVGPVFAESKFNGHTRLTGSTEKLPDGQIKLSPVELSPYEVDYYPGLTLDKVSNDRDLKTFSDIDLDGNKSLSAEEIILHGNKEKLNNLKQITAVRKENRWMNILGIASTGTILGALVAVLGGGAIPLGIIIVGTVITSIPAGIYAYFSHRSLSKECYKPIKELESQIEKGTEEILGKTQEAK